MTPTKLAAAFMLALCLAPGVSTRGGQGEPAPSPSKGFRQARQVSVGGAPDRSAFEFEAGGFSYRVAANGNGRRMKGDKTRRFNLRLDGRDYIERVLFTEYEGDLLLVCELNDGETGGGLVTRLEQPSMRALWKQQLPAFNVGEPLREGHNLYVTGLGFVGKLDLRTGEYVWYHDDLYDTHAPATAKAFNSFELPQLSGDTVLFRDRPVYGTRKTLVVNKKTGKIVRVE